MIGGLAFAGVGDRFRRGPVMVVVALIRAVLFAAMAMSGLGIPALIGLLVVAVVLGPIFTATEVAFLSDVLDEPVFAAGTGVRLTANQLSQVGGFAIGGVLVAGFGAHAALLVNAATFVVAAALVGWAAHGARQSGDHRQPSAQRSLRAAATWFRRHRLMLALLGLSALDGLFFAPEGLAVPFAADVGAGAAGAGLLLAALPLGSAVGAALLVRVVPYRQRPIAARWMAAGCGLPLVVTALAPPWPVALGCWVLTGVLSAYQVVVITTVAQAAPDAQRARIIGFGGAIVVAAQGIGLAAFGALAQLVEPGVSIAVAGLVGSALAGLLIVGPLSGWAVTAERT
jgi:hypothetical protein